MTRGDDPVPLRDAVAEVTRELGLPAPDAVAALHAAWPAIVGTDVAAHARVRSIRAGECTIAVDGPAWATRLRYLGDDVVTAARECCGPGVVTSVRVVVADG